MNKFHAEASGLDHVAGLVGHQLDGIRQMMLLQLQLDQAVGHGGAMDGAVHLTHAVGDGADVVFMPVGDEHAPELFLVGHQIRKVGDHQVYAVHILFREAYAAVHHDHVSAVFQNGNVLTDFIQSTQGNDF